MWYKKTALALSAIGAINWIFVQLNFNLVEKLIASWAGMMTASIVYWIIGLCGVYAFARLFR